MAKDTFYFTHDYGARNDPRLIKVLMKLGQSGKGIYWDLIEMLYEQDGYLLISEIDAYAFALRSDSDTINSLINDFDLFDKNSENFWSNSVLRRLEKRDEKSKKASESARNRWDKAKSNANALQTQYDGNAIKESKVKENKKNESKVNSNPPAKSPVHKECKDFFLKFYEDKKGTGYYFQAIDGKKLNSIIKKIEFKIKEKGCAEKEKDLEVIRGFKIFIEHAYKDTDNWTRDNFSLSVIDSKFNDIFSKIKNGQSTSDNKSSDRHALAEQLRAMRQSGSSSFG